MSLLGTLTGSADAVALKADEMLLLCCPDTCLNTHEKISGSAGAVVNKVISKRSAFSKQGSCTMHT